MDDAIDSVLSFLARIRPQVFLPQCLLEAFFAASIAGRMGIPWILTLHSDGGHPYYDALKVLSPLEPNCSVVGVSKKIASTALARFNTQAEVIPCGVPPSNLIAGWNDEKFTVVYSGRAVENEKRISLVVRSMIEACRLEERIRCKVLGDGIDLDLVKAMVRNELLEDRICFLGRLAFKDVSHELAQAQAILLMSDIEGMPVCLMEAMAQGVVPIARDIPSGIPELIEDGVSGFLVDESPISAAKTINRLANSRQLWELCAANARKTYESGFQESVCFERWQELIRKISIDAEAATRINFSADKTLPFKVQLKYCDLFKNRTLLVSIYWCFAHLPRKVVQQVLNSRIVVRGPQKVMRLLKRFS